jgi:LPPG:FO 2-phospho-L-lactate transferase
MMEELGYAVNVLTVAAHYRDLIDGLVIDTADAQLAARLELPVAIKPGLMRSLSDRERLARAAVEFADCLANTAAPNGV